MSQLLSASARAHRLATLCVIAPVFCLAVFWAVVESAVAEGGPTVTRVEEDWELVVATPDTNSVAPQVTCVFSPVGNINSLYAALELNHQSVPDFVPGGLQLQIWEGEIHRHTRKYPNASVMSSSGETVRWTQCMELKDGTLTFEVRNGGSSTWGSFGGQGYLKATAATGLTSLNGYDPSVSVNNSGIGYASNRVQSLVIKRVRVYTASGLLFEDNTAREVYSSN